MITWKFLCGAFVLGLAACGGVLGDRIPFDVDGRTYVVSGVRGQPDPDTDAIVTGAGGAGLTQADGPAANRAFAAYCQTQGREDGTAGRFVMSGPDGGYWLYEACLQ